MAAKALKKTTSVADQSLSARFMIQEIALNDVEIGWHHDFRTRSFKENLLNRQMVSWLVEKLETAYPISPTLRADRLNEIATFVEAEGLSAGYSLETLRLFAQQLRDAAGRQFLNYAPWTEVVDRDELTPQQRRILDSLWRHNEHQATNWKVPLSTFVEEVWGDEHTLKSTVGSAVTNLVKKLLTSELQIAISIRRTSPNPHVECRIFE